MNFKQLRLIVESLDDQLFTDVSYEEALNLYNRLSEKEKKYVAPRGKYVDSPALLLRKGLINDNCCYAFCDVYHFKDDDPDTGIIIVAVDPMNRGDGSGKRAVREAMKAAKKHGITKFIYRVDKTNKPSQGLVKSLGGKLVDEDEKDLKFEIKQ